MSCPEKQIEYLIESVSETLARVAREDSGLTKKELLAACQRGIKRGSVDLDASIKMGKVYLAEERRANGDDDAEFVIAIIAASRKQAEAIAAKHDAELIACHDGDSVYRIVTE